MKRLSEDVGNHLISRHVLNNDLARCNIVRDEEVSDLDVSGALARRTTLVSKEDRRLVVLVQNSGPYGDSLAQQVFPRPEDLG
jgi:hypothetical protein